MAATHCIVGANRVALAYKQYLNGVPLEKIEETDQVKNIILEFNKYSMLTAYEISQKSPEISSDIASKLRQLKRSHRKKLMENRDDALTFIVKQCSGKSANKVISSIVTRDTLKAGTTIAKMAKEGKSVQEISKSVKICENKVKRVLKDSGIKIKV